MNPSFPGRFAAYGTNGTATIEHYELVARAGRGGEYRVYSLPQAEAIVMTLHYAGHSSTISIDETDPNFNTVYSIAHTPGSEIAVRYLSWLPPIVLPDTLVQPEGQYTR
jgi:hypothetical protein